MKSHTSRINRGVHGASWERSRTTSFAATSGVLQDPKRRHEPGDQAWATTLVMVDVAARIRCVRQSRRGLMKMRISQRCVQHSSNGWRMRKQS